MAPHLDAVVMDPLLLLGITVAAAPVIDRLGRAAPGVSRWRWVALASAVLLLAATWVSPLQGLASHYLLSAHLLQTMVIMGVAPPLLLLALPPGRGRRWPGWLARSGHLVTNPGVAIVLVNLVFFLSHSAGPFEMALNHSWAYDLGELALLATSIAFWWPIISPDGRATLVSPLGKLGYILLATIPQTFAGLTLALTKHVVYPTYAAAPRILGISAGDDQAIAGACLALLSKAALFIAFSIIFVRLFDSAPSDDDDGGGGRGDEPAPVPPGQPAWLLDLEAGRVQPEPAADRSRRRERTPVGSGAV
jgi:putative membrane protein